MGTPDFAVASLKAIHESDHDVVGVVTIADKPAGRGQKLRASAVKNYAVEQNLNILQPEKLKAPEFLDALQALNADLFLVVAFRMLPEVVWAMPEMGTINLHGSLLPDYRGAAPINWAVMNGDKETGATTFFIEKDIDTGNVIDSCRIAIGENATAGEVHDELMVEGAQLLKRTVDQIADGTAKSIPQADMIKGERREAPKIFKDTCRIDWSKTAAEVHNHIRGLSPYPASWTVLQGEKEVNVKIYLSSLSDRKLEQGQFLQEGKQLFVGCGNGAIEIHTLQMAGKKRMNTADFLNGIKLDTYTNFE